MDQPAIQSAPLPPAPANLEQPANPQPFKAPHFWNRQAAKDAAAKSADVRRNNARLRKQVLLPAIDAQTDEAVLTAKRLQILSLQIARTHKILTSDEISHKDRAQLLNALDRLIERERILRGIPAPQNTRENIRTLQVKVQPIISPQPAPRLPANLPEAQPPSLPDVQDQP
jgi:hypothetical protein